MVISSQDNNKKRTNFLPKVSIIVPVYGVERFIEFSSRSVFTQTYPNCEFIFIDDCSKDKSIEILNNVIVEFPSLRNKIKIISHNINLGLAYARNTGVEAASGDYIMHVDSDDYIETNTVELAINKANEENADVVIFGYSHIFNKYKLPIHVLVPNTKEDYIRSLISRDSYVNIWGALYKRSLYIENNILAIPGLNMGEDYVTKPRLIYFASKIAFLDAPLYNYNHINENSYTTKFSKKHINDISSAINILLSFFKQQSDFDLYKTSLDKACMTSKVLLLKSWALSDEDTSLAVQVKDLWSNIVKKDINLQDRALLYLNNIGKNFLIRYYIRIGLRIKKIFDLIKHINM